jgi:hypothetical protein
MYYVEFYSRKPRVSPEQFRDTVKRTDAWWAANNPEDRPVLAIGRTWRLGGPHYIVVWEIDSAARIDEWNERAIEDWLEVVDCDAGLYEDLGLELVRASEPPCPSDGQL